jgi:uncharacterized protein YhaN
MNSNEQPSSDRLQQVETQVAGLQQRVANLEAIVQRLLQHDPAFTQTVTALSEALEGAKDTQSLNSFQS